ncbi:MAG TPA: FAD-dependent oxidoreductase [Candidatus Aquabacterium excrementipullorum]|nr:FAD-dependent oxidoreductase [Candidatus Aquabacterium excrementipullorum]
MSTPQRSWPTWSRRGWLGWSAGAVAGLALPGCGPRGVTSLRDTEQAGGVAGITARLPDTLQGGWVGQQVERGHAWRDGRWKPGGGLVFTRRVHTLVVGAGIAGLAAARVLQDNGLDDLAVLDLDDEPGGNARGHTLMGQPCPLGAHYLPVPGEDAHEVAQWLESQGLIRRQQGRWVGDERHLCHSPQERLFVPDTAAQQTGACWPGHWQEGLMPAGQGTQAQHHRFMQEARRLRHELGFAMPTIRRAWNTGLAALDAITFDRWLDAQGFDDPGLRWALDYACRDDYGAGSARVSAWAGLQYFASRHGDDGENGEAADALLTWPDGNAFLVRRLAQGLGDRWHAGTVALAITPNRREVVVDTWSVRRNRPERWIARRVVMATPLMVSHRLLTAPPAPLKAVMPLLRHAPWLVSNLALREPLVERQGAPLSWDNVAYTRQGPASLPEPSLGYVNARHQSLAPPPAEASVVLTHYWALGGRDVATEQRHRGLLWSQPWRWWAQQVVDDLARVHPDLPGKLQRIDLMRWGHAMAIPVPGLRGHPALAALADGEVSRQSRLHWAHADLSAYSVFEEAFTHGVRAARQVLRLEGPPQRLAWGRPRDTA